MATNQPTAHCVQRQIKFRRANTEKTGRSRAERMYPECLPCVVCGSQRSERHHDDGNTLNNEPGNIKWLCRKCHMKRDGRLVAARDSMLAIRDAGVSRAAEVHRNPATAESGDACPKCGNRLGVTAVRIRNGAKFTYIGCRKSRGGCGYNAGATKQEV